MSHSDTVATVCSRIVAIHSMSHRDTVATVCSRIVAIHSDTVATVCSRIIRAKRRVDKIIPMNAHALHALSKLLLRLLLRSICLVLPSPHDRNGGCNEDKPNNYAPCHPRSVTERLRTFRRSSTTTTTTTIVAVVIRYHVVAVVAVAISVVIGICICIGVGRGVGVCWRS